MISKGIYDIFGRIGSEEFAMMLSETNLKTTKILAEQMHKTIEQLSLPLVSGEQVKFTVSIGLTEYSEQDKGIFALLSRADKTLYQAKLTSKNGVVN